MNRNSRRNVPMKLLWAAAMSIVLGGATVTVHALEPLPYNHPGLTVDLGVGLWAWPVPCDADGDGDFDLLVSCPDKPSNGVWYFENPTQNDRDKLPVFRPGRKVSRTVHYVMPSYVDGRMRVLSPGFEYPEFTTQGLEASTPLPIPSNVYKPQWTTTKGPRVRHNQWRYVDYDGNGALDLVIGVEDWSHYGWDDAWNERGEWTAGPLHGFVYWFRNRGTTAMPDYESMVEIQADGRRVDVFGCPSPNFEDFDGDGDLDLLCGEFLDGFTYFANTGTRTEPRYAAGRRLQTASGAPLVMDLEMIVPVAFDWDKDGDKDLIVGDEDGRVALIEHTGKLVDDVPVFAAPVYFRQQADTLKCGALATPFAADVDGDGDQDLLCGNTAGVIELFENLSGKGVEHPRWQAPVRIQAADRPFRVMAGPNGSIQGPAEAKWGYTTLNVADWDGDGRLDVVFNSIWGKVQWLRNIGSPNSPRWDAPQPVPFDEAAPKPGKPKWTWWNPAEREFVTQWRTTPMIFDFTGDGQLDLGSLDVEGYPAVFAGVISKGAKTVSQGQRLVLNSRGEPLRWNAKSAGGSGRRKWAVTDWDGDGRFDLLLNSANADLYRQLPPNPLANERGWRFADPVPLATRNIEGHDVSPAVVDFNGDDVPDLLGGAEDGRLYYLRNPRSDAPK